MRKEKLIDEVFPDFDLERGIIHLQTVISHIRKLGLEIHYFDNAYMVNTVGLQYDVARFLTVHETIRKSKSAYDVKTALEMIDLYTGPFLEEDAFSWCMPYTAQLENMVLEVLDRLLTNEEVLRDKQLLNQLKKKQNTLSALED